jgi:hypothetical protein
VEPPQPQAALLGGAMAFHPLSLADAVRLVGGPNVLLALIADAQVRTTTTTISHSAHSSSPNHATHNPTCSLQFSLLPQNEEELNCTLDLLCALLPPNPGLTREFEALDGYVGIIIAIIVIIMHYYSY